MNLNFRYIVRTLLILVCEKVNSQTLTCQYNCPQKGEVFSTRTSSPVAHSSGLNQLWNFTQLQAVSSGVGTISYVDPASTPSSSLFPQANIAKLESGNYMFLDAGNSGVKLATSSNVTVSAQSSVLPLPFSYGSSHSETIVTTYLKGSDTMEVTTTKKLDGVGTGTLLLPSGTFTDVLRISGEVVDSRTKNGLPEGYVVTNHVNYYYSERISHPLLYTEYKSETGPTDYAPFTQFVVSISTSVRNEDTEVSSAILISPNPTSGTIRMTVPEAGSYELVIFNSMGKIVSAQNCAAGTTILDLGQLPDGLYTLLIKQEGLMRSGKLVVSH